MKTTSLITVLLLTATTLQARETVPPQKAAAMQKAATGVALFIENKGQITDQYGAMRKDIDYKLSGGDVTLFVGDGQLHYQWSKSNTNTKNEKLNTKSLANKKSPSGDLGVSIYRMDVTLLGADKNAVAVAEDMQPYYENYYLPAVPNGATAHSYRKITYKNVYPHIDWVVYTSKSPEGDFAGGIKYDFIVHPGGNVADIQLQYDGTTALALKDGALVAATPMGSITEDAPYCYTAGNKEAVTSRYVLEGNVLRYDVANTAANTTLIIDPALRWATYYRSIVSSTPHVGGVVASDTAGNVYHAGSTQTASNVAISGGHQTTIGGGIDFFIVKFNGNGVPQWATYYGGTGTEGDVAGGRQYDIAAEPDGTVYLVGTTSSSGLATTGSFQSAKSGATYDALLVKFNTSGVRQWATYYGGSTTGSGSIFDAICYDATSNHIYVGGGTDATTNIATTGTYMTTKPGSSGAGMLVKFNTSGGRVWGSYYPEYITALTTDIYGNCYVGIYGVLATTGIGTGGTYQPSLVSGAAASSSIGKFNASGGYLWGTYYSSSIGNILMYDLKADNKGTAVYAACSTTCSTGVTTTGIHQSSFGGPTNGADALLTKFSATNGTRIWSTYNGGTGDDGATGITVLPDDNIVMLGRTTSSNNIASTGAMQSSLGAQNNVFFAIFTPDGMRPYGTYYGLGNCATGTIGNCVSNGKGRIAASLRGSVSYTTSGAYLTTPGESYIMQLDADTSVYIRQPFADTVVCSGDTLSIPYGVVQNFRSTNNFIFELSNATGSFASGVTTLGTLTAAQTGGLFHYVVPHSTTQSSLYRVRVRSTAPLDTAYEEVNIRITTTPQSPTATNNGPVCSGNPLNISSSSTTAGVTYSWSGPSGYTSTAQNPVRNPGYTKYTGDYIVTITNNGCISKDTTTAAVDSTPIAITAGNNGPLCVGSDLQLTATNSTSGATYHWSGPSFTNTTQNPTINNVGLANSGVYSVYASLSTCNTATVTTTVSVVNGPSVSIYPSPKDTICGNPTGSATFNASSTGGAGYQWYKNGTVIPGATGTTYAATGIQTGDVFYVKLTPGTGAACNTPVNSNHITMTVMPYVTPSVTITVSPDSTTWSGVMLTFTATATNAGNNPKYQWKVNGVSMAGAISNVWGAPNLNDKDKVTCEVTSSYICPQPQKITSNTVTLKIKTGINNIEGNNISIYPNPTQTTLTVEGVRKGTIIQLKDVLGRQVIHTVATQTKTVLNTAHIAAGNYLLVLTTTDGEVLTEKLVKE